MFQTSFWLLISSLFYNVILPLIPGILFLRICFWKKFHGMLLYLLGWSIWVGVVAFSLFNLQFIHFGIDVSEYFLLLWLLVFIFVAKIFFQKSDVKTYFVTLKIKNLFPQIKKSFFSLSLVEKIFTIFSWLLGVYFLILTFIHTTHFPSYAFDSFYNWNNTAYTIYLDEGVKVMWEKTEILAQGRLGYPIYIPLYKATVSHFIGWFTMIYINIRQWLVFLTMVLFIFITTFFVTKNIFYSLLPIALIVCLPLVYFHATEWYMELPSVLYALLTIWAFWKFLEEKDYVYISLAILSWCILSYIKNDGFVVYSPAIFISFLMILLNTKSLIKTLLWFFKNIYQVALSLFFFLFFLLPFLFIKMHYHLGFNQAWWMESWIGISSAVHRNIFTVFPMIFFQMDNYNLILIVIFLFVWFFIQKKNTISSSSKFLLYAPLSTFIILLLVFLLTRNFLFVLDQTTVNRVFTVVFILLFAFSWYIFVQYDMMDRKAL